MDAIKYRAMLAEIAGSIQVEGPDSELQAMKFMCTGIIPRRIGEQIDSTLKLWVALEERDKLSPGDTVFLRYLLQHCTDKRTDLMKILQKYEQLEQGASYDPTGSYFPPLSQGNRN